MRVVIAEDSVLLRAGLESILTDESIDVSAAVGDGPSLVDAVSRTRPDVAIVDVRMPPSFTDEGLRAAIRARRETPETAIMILSHHVEERYAAELLEIGHGVGYLLKDRVSAIDEFLESLHRVAGGGTALDPEVVAQLLGQRRRRGHLDALTAREREVLGLMAEGRTNKGIAEHLVITERAVEKHVTRIFDKLLLPNAPSDHRRVLAVLAHLNR